MTMTLAYTLKVLYSRIRKLYRDFFSGTNPLIFLDIVCGHQDCCKRFLAIASAAAAVVKCTTVCMHRPSMWQRSAPLGAASDWLIDRWSHITAQTAGYFPMRSFHAIFLRQTLADLQCIPIRNSNRFGFPKNRTVRFDHGVTTACWSL